MLVELWSQQEMSMLKSLIVFLAMGFPFIAFASEREKTLKTCETTIHFPDKDLRFVIKIVEVEGEQRSVIQQYEGAQSETTAGDVNIVEDLNVRPGLSAGKWVPSDYNSAEGEISSAMFIVKNPKVPMSAGLDLEKVRSAKIYDIIPGFFSIVEAKDEGGKTMGTFLNGVYVSPCK